MFLLLFHPPFLSASFQFCYLFCITPFYSPLSVSPSCLQFYCLCVRFFLALLARNRTRINILSHPMRWLLVCYCMFFYFFINLFLNGFRCVNCVNVLAYLALVKLILISIPRTRPHTHSRPYYRNQSPVPVCFQANKKGDILKLLQLSMFNPKMVKNRPLIPHYHTLVYLLKSLTPTLSQTHTYIQVRKSREALR